MSEGEGEVKVVVGVNLFLATSLFQMTEVLFRTLLFTYLRVCVSVCECARVSVCVCAFTLPEPRKHQRFSLLMK